MTTEHRYSEGKIKSFDTGYIYCEQCESNGVPNQKVVIVYLGIRPANEPGFIHKFETYDYSQDRANEIHRHKSDPKLIDQLVNATLSKRGVVAH